MSASPTFMLAAALAISAPGSPGLRSECSESLRPAVAIAALGSNVTPFGTAGYVIDQPGHYVLRRNLSYRRLDVGILIASANVTLDLDGYALHDQSGESTLILMRSSPVRATIRNGTLAGGSTSIDAQGPTDLGRLVLDRVRTRSSGSRSLLVRSITEVFIHSGVYEGARDAVLVEGAARMQVLGSILIGVESGLEVRSSGLLRVKGEIRGNLLQGRRAVAVDSGILLTQNEIAGSLMLESNLARVVENVVRSAGTPHAIRVSGSQNIVEGNHVFGGTRAGLLVTGDSNRVSWNSILSQGTGVEASGVHQLIEHNRFKAGGRGCGIRFTDDGGHVHRANEMRGTGTLICGFFNTEGESLPTENRRVQRPPSLPPQRRPPPGRSPVSGPCLPDSVVPVHDIAPGVTPFGPADLVIDQPGYYLLTRDITLTPFSNGIAILSGGVTLDLGGFRVLCPSSCSAMVRIWESGRVTVRNGMIQGGETSIEAVRSSTVRLEDLHARCATSSGCLALSTFQVGRVEVERSRLFGFESSVQISATTCLVRDSEIGSSEAGLLAVVAEGATISGNILRGDDFGLLLSGDGLIADNLIVAGLPGTALRLQSGRATVTGNTLLGNGGGLAIFGGEGHVIENNLLRRVDMTVVTGGNLIRGNVLVDNFFDDQTAFGILVRNSRNVLEDNLILHGYCGIEFADCHEVALVDNIILDAQEGTCGAKVGTGDGNILPPSTCGNNLAGPEEVCDGFDPGELICDPGRFGDCLVNCNATCDGFDLVYCP